MKAIGRTYSNRKNLIEKKYYIGCTQKHFFSQFIFRIGGVKRDDDGIT